MPDCIFCKIANHKVEMSDVFYEDDKLIVMLDKDWTTKGHSLVVWKEHRLNISDLSTEESAHFMEVTRRVEQALLAVLKKERSIVLKTGLLQSHFHFHIYPVAFDMPWDEVIAMFSKKVRYEPAERESEALIADLRGMLA